MTFLWPEMLWLLVLVPLVAAAYLVVLRRRQKSSVRYAGLAMFREALGPGQRSAATCLRCCSSSPSR